MKNRILITLAVVFCAVSIMLGQTAFVAALGAPSDNTTIPGSPAGEKPADEIKPPVEYVLMGATSQPDTNTPNLIARLLTPSGQNEPAVTGSENWYLDIDINDPGWIYIYEHFPSSQIRPGRWLAYKWELLESGLWRLGPFSAADNEPVGQHIYRLWFYSDGQWAAVNTGASPNNLIYWTYSEGKPAEPAVVQSPPAPAESTGFWARVYEFFSKPAVLITLAAVLIAGLIVLVVHFWRRRLKETDSTTDSIATSTAAQPVAVAIAKLVLPNGIDISLFEGSRIIGRGDLARALSLDDLALISRQHLEIKLEEEQFYVKDLGAANGTRLNGKNISGKGQVNLKDGDTIEPAGAVPLKFHLL